MSLPELSDSSISREEAINQIISSIAMEELSLSCIINAEGEKLQYVLGTLAGSTGPSATIDKVLEINESIRNVLQEALENQLVLRSKLQDALSSAVLTGPAGPTGPTGSVDISGIQVSLVNSGDDEIIDGARIIFDTVTQRVGDAISYDDSTGPDRGTFTLSRNGVYMVNWWIAADGTEHELGTNYSLDVSTATDTIHYEASSPLVTSQVAGTALIVLNERNPAPATVALTNQSNNTITLEDVFAQGSISIVTIPDTQNGG